MIHMSLKRGLLPTVSVEVARSGNLLLAFYRHHEVGRLLGLVEVVDIHSDLLIIAAIFLLFHRLSLAVGV